MFFWELIYTRFWRSNNSKYKRQHRTDFFETKSRLKKNLETVTMFYSLNFNNDDFLKLLIETLWRFSIKFKSSRERREQFKRVSIAAKWQSLKWEKRDVIKKLIDLLYYKKNEWKIFSKSINHYCCQCFCIVASIASVIYIALAFLIVCYLIVLVLLFDLFALIFVLVYRVVFSKKNVCREIVQSKLYF